MRAGLFLASIVLACAGCATPTGTRYFSLADTAPAPVLLSGVEPACRVAFAPATLPEAVDRRQLVLRIAPGRYEISDANGWLSPLRYEIPRAIADEVRALLPQASVVAYRQHGGQGADYRVALDVVRFESAPGDSVTLEATWSVRSRAGELLRESSATYAVPVNDAGIDAVVAAHRKALAKIGKDIAEALGVLDLAGSNSAGNRPNQPN